MLPACIVWFYYSTVNREYFDVKIFSDSMHIWLVRKLNAQITCAILTTMRYRVVCPKII